MSKGPVTAEGKAKSSQNAVTHGLCANAIVLSCENPEEYQKLYDDYFARFQPQDQPERDQVIAMINCVWRQRRFWNIETGKMNLRVEDREKPLQKAHKVVTDQMRVAIAFSWEQDVLKSLDRHETRILRQYHRAHKELQELQKNRPPANPEKLQNEPNPKSEQFENPRESALISGESELGPLTRNGSTDPEHQPNPDPCSSVLIDGETQTPPLKTNDKNGFVRLPRESEIDSPPDNPEQSENRCLSGLIGGPSDSPLKTNDQNGFVRFTRYLSPDPQNPPGEPR